MNTLLIGELLGVPVALTAAEFEQARQRAASLAPAPHSPVPELVDAAAAAAHLGVTARLIADLTRNGTLPHHKIGRSIRYDLSELARCTQKQSSGGISGPADRSNGSPIRRRAFTP